MTQLCDEGGGDAETPGRGEDPGRAREETRDDSKRARCGGLRVGGEDPGAWLAPAPRARVAREDEMEGEGTYMSTRRMREVTKDGLVDRVRVRAASRERVLNPRGRGALISRRPRQPPAPPASDSSGTISGSCTPAETSRGGGWGSEGRSSSTRRFAGARGGARGRGTGTADRRRAGPVGSGRGDGRTCTLPFAVHARRM